MDESRSLIFDTGTSRCLLRESKVYKPAEGSNVLGVLEGPCADFTRETRNNNLYSRNLWQRVIESDYVKESLETRTLFGALDHPENLDNFAGDAAVSCTKLWIDEAEDCLMGTFDVLPTAKGRILDSLLKYGSILGVSSRGVGDLTPNSEGVQVVDENNYLFVCFDVVTQPAAIKARQKYKSLTESATPGTKSLLDTLLDSIRDSQSERDLDSVMSIAHKLGLDNHEKLKESVEIVKSNLKKLEEGSIINVEVMKSDLEKAYAQIRALQESGTGNAGLLAEMGALRSQFALMKQLVETYQSDAQGTEKKSVRESRKQLRELYELVIGLAKSQQESTEMYRSTLSRLEESFEERLAEANKLLHSKSVAMVRRGEEITKLQESLKFSVDFVEKCKVALAQRDSLLETYQREKVALEEAIRRQPAQQAVPKVSPRVSVNEEYVRRKEVEHGVDLSATIPEAIKCQTLREVDELLNKVLDRPQPKKRAGLAESLSFAKVDPYESVGTDDSNGSSVMREALRRQQY